MGGINRILPQEGFQMDFLSTRADIAIGGGAAGAGKTFALLMESLRHIQKPLFGGVIFRRTSPQIRSGGGLWETSTALYSPTGAMPRESLLEWKFPDGARIKFSHLEHEKNVLDWQGSQLAFIGFDELTHFTQHMFFYLLSRNRSTCGVRPYVRATCNPDPDSWVADFLSWWIDQETGFPIRERAGLLRYFLKDSDTLVWGDSKEEVIDKCPHLINTITQASPDINPQDLIKSVTFIPGDIYSNTALLRADPSYLGNLMAQDEATKQQLLHGNWKIRVDGSDLINPIKLRDCFTNDFVQGGRRCITADIALKGSDLLVIGVWDGWRLIEIKIIGKAKGDEVVEAIKSLAHEYGVPQSEIVYDDDGAGSFVDGFIRGARPFHNGGVPIYRENYKNLKTQMFYRLAERIRLDGIYITPEVSTQRVNGRTVRDHILEERRAIKRDKMDMDGKLCIIPKEKMKVVIGHSPDFMDMLMMRGYLEIFKKPNQKQRTKKGYGFY